MGMGTGVQGGGLARDTDVFNAGDLAWESVTGMSPLNPLVGGPTVEGLGIYDVDRGAQRIVTTPQGQMGAAGDVVASTPEGMHQFDSWRDLLNFRGSPMPWLLAGSIVVLGLMQFRISARSRIGPASVDAAVG